MAAKGNGHWLLGWARRKSRSRSFLYETLPQTEPRVTSSWFFEGDPVGDAGGLGTASGVGASVVAATGTAAGTVTVLGGAVSPLELGIGAVRQKIYHDPLETTSGGSLTTWETDLTFTSSDINTTSDVIAFSSAHNMIRAEGPFRVTSDNTLPGGLTAGVDYYIIRDSSTGIKLATSAQNAVTGTAVNLTSGGSGTHTLVRRKDSQGDGSAFLLMAALGTWSLSPEAPTDNKGNTYTALAGSPISYSSFVASKAGCWAVLGDSSSGGAGHTASKTWSDESPPGTTSSDEPTIAMLEIKGARVVKSATQKETAIGSATITSNAVTATGPAILVGVIFGNGPVGQDHTWTWGSGFTGIPECSATGDTSANGYIQIAVGYKIVDTNGSYSFSASGVSNEGGQMYLFAFQASEPTGSAAGTSTADATSASIAAATGEASGTGTADGIAYSPGSPGTAAGTSDAAGVGTAIYSSAGSASGTSTPAAVGASTAAAAGSASGTSTPTAVGAATAAGAGAATGTGTSAATGAATAAAAGASSGTSTPTATGAATATGAGASSGAATAAAVGGAIAAGTGASAGSGTATSAGSGTQAGTGDAAGTGTAGAAATAIVAAAGAASGTGTAAAVADEGVPLPLPAILTITAPALEPFAIATFPGESPFAVSADAGSPAVAADPGAFAIAAPAADPFIVVGAALPFTVAPSVDAPFTVEEV